MTRVLLDGNIYDKLEADPPTRELIAELVRDGALSILATPVVVDELREGPFQGVPEWFPVSVECEAVCVIGYARLGMAMISNGHIYDRHRGTSRKFPDAIIAESAHAMADILVSEDRRCRKRLADCSDRCRPMCYAEFCDWLKDTPQK
jgi:hypothetical protein